jgi:hypothetical protein
MVYLQVGPEVPGQVAGEVVETAPAGGTITAICSFMVDCLSRTTAAADLVDARHPGYSDPAAEPARVQAGPCDYRAAIRSPLGRAPSRPHDVLPRVNGGGVQRPSRRPG